MKIMGSFIGVVALLLLLAAPAQADPVGKITCVEGSVEIASPGRTARSAHIGAEVYRGDIIRTQTRARVEITFTDAAIMRLSQQSRVEISDSIRERGMRRGVLGLFSVEIGSPASKFLNMASFLFQNSQEVPDTAVAGVR